MTDTTKPLTPYQQRRRQITAAVKQWMEDPDRTQDPREEAGTLIEALHDAGLQILPRCPSYAQWRVVVDGAPAPSPRAPGQLSGPMDADDAAEAFLLAAAQAELDNTDTAITVRPASDHELVAKLVGVTALRPDPVTVQMTTWAFLQRGDRMVLAFTGDDHTLVEADFDAPGFANFAHAMAEESEGDEE